MNPFEDNEQFKNLKKTLKEEEHQKEEAKKPVKKPKPKKLGPEEGFRDIEEAFISAKDIEAEIIESFKEEEIEPVPEKKTKKRQKTKNDFERLDESDLKKLFGRKS